eukprot:scaffold4516_cov417-Prasinococcus_capsulatus_cf.AAC.6
MHALCAAALQIPVLLVDGQPKIESEDINLYLEELAPEPTVYPSTSKLYSTKGPRKWIPFGKNSVNADLEVTAEELSRRIDKEFGPVFGGIFFQRVALPSLGGSTDAKLLAELEEMAFDILRKLEAELAKKKSFYLGKAFSVVDIAYGTWLRQGQLGGFEIDAKQFPSVALYLRRVYSYGGFKKAIKWENQDATISMIKENFTAEFTRPMIEG